MKINEGVYVGGFSDRSTAKEAGLLVGDVIIAINSTTIRTVGELQDQINRYNPGDNVILSIFRGDSTLSMSVVLKNLVGSTSVINKTCQ